MRRTPCEQSIDYDNLESTISARHSALSTSSAISSNLISKDRARRSSGTVHRWRFFAGSSARSKGPTDKAKVVRPVTPHSETHPSQSPHARWIQLQSGPPLATRHPPCSRDYLALNPTNHPPTAQHSPSPPCKMVSTGLIRIRAVRLVAKDGSPRRPGDARQTSAPVRMITYNQFLSLLLTFLPSSISNACSFHSPPDLHRAGTAASPRHSLHRPPT